jgi:hypothetical protein
VSQVFCIQDENALFYNITLDCNDGSIIYALALQISYGVAAQPRCFWGLWIMCHYWPNFKIAAVDLFPLPQYRHMFRFLDEDGGFYYER